jgi:hypothetical protein
MADDAAWWSVYLGTFRLGKADSTLEGGFEVRLPARIQKLSYVGGVAATVDEAVWVYGGVRWRQPIGGKWALSPGFAVALFEEGEGKDLGGPVEFRSSLELSHRRSERSEIGLILYHLSNAGIYDENPGCNSPVVSYTFRPGHR